MEKEKIETKEQKKERKREIKRQLKEAKVKKQLGSFFADFKKFISKGNIIDLSVAVVIGAAFNKIVNSLVNDIIMPFISLLTGGASVVDWKWIIKEATYDTAGNVLTAETAFRYGVFLQAIIDFLIVALTIFVILRIIVNSQRGFDKFSKRMKKAMKKALKNGDEETIAAITETVQVPVETKKIESQEEILKDIRELLKKSMVMEEVTQEKEEIKN